MFRSVLGRQPAAAMLPTAMWAGNSAQTWNALIRALGLPASPAIGDRIAASAPDAPPFAGTVVNVGRKSMAILIEEPCPGTGIIAAEGSGEHTAVSIWSYLYGPDRVATVQQFEPRWSRWLSDHGAKQPLDELS